mmetsp:Transcript_3356/g.12477  ORF Transcript_3356/g.12477 Transcript_3356/m.12477 type:complete len:329 (-) Transcript_3356:2047-3033(-)
MYSTLARDEAPSLSVARDAPLRAPCHDDERRHTSSREKRRAHGHCVLLRRSQRSRLAVRRGQLVENGERILFVRASKRRRFARRTLEPIFVHHGRSPRGVVMDVPGAGDDLLCFAGYFRGRFRLNRFLSPRRLHPDARDGVLILLLLSRRRGVGIRRGDVEPLRDHRLVLEVDVVPYRLHARRGHVQVVRSQRHVQGDPASSALGVPVSVPAARAVRLRLGVSLSPLFLPLPRFHLLHRKRLGKRPLRLRHGFEQRPCFVNVFVRSFRAYKRSDSGSVKRLLPVIGVAQCICFPVNLSRGGGGARLLLVQNSPDLSRRLCFRSRCSSV